MTLEASEFLRRYLPARAPLWGLTVRHLWVPECRQQPVAGVGAVADPAVAEPGVAALQGWRVSVGPGRGRRRAVRSAEGVLIVMGFAGREARAVAI